MVEELKLILHYLNEKRGFDFSGYRISMVERRVQQRFASIKCESYNDYLHYLKENSDEFDHLIDALTINVSRFFRDTLTFEYIADRILPAIFHEKKKAWNPKQASSQLILTVRYWKKHKRNPIHLTASKV